MRKKFPEAGCSAASAQRPDVRSPRRRPRDRSDRAVRRLARKDLAIIGSETSAPIVMQAGEKTVELEWCPRSSPPSLPQYQ